MSAFLAISLSDVTFATPVLLGALALAVPVIALYLWWRRRQKVQVSYLRIWERVAKRQRQSIWRWLRWLLSMLIAVALVGGIVLVAAGVREGQEPAPAPEPPDQTATRLVVLVDTSPSVLDPEWSAAGSREWVTGRLRELAAALDRDRGDTLDVILVDGDAGPRWVDLQREPDALATWQPQPSWHPVDLVTLAQMVQRVMALRNAPEQNLQAELVVITDGQPPATGWEREITAEGVEVWRREASGQDLVATVWRPAPSATVNVGIVNVELRPPAPAVPELAQITVIANRDGGANHGGDDAPPISVTITCDPALGEPVVIDVTPGTPSVVRIPLPDRVPDDARRQAVGPHTWLLAVNAYATDNALALADARSGDDRVELALPVIEPVPVVVAGSGVRNPLVIPLMRLLESQGVLRVVRSRDPRPDGQSPVLMLLDDAPPGALPEHSALLQISPLSRVADDLIRPGNLLEWSTRHTLFRVDDIAFVPLAVREARALQPVSDRTIPLLTAPQGVVADYTPASVEPDSAVATVPTVRIGFSLAPDTTDFLLQASLAPVLIKRLIRLLAPRVRPPIPAIAALGRPFEVDLTPGSALAAAAWPNGRLTVDLPTAHGNETRGLDLPGPPLELVAGTPAYPGNARVRAHATGRRPVDWQLPVRLLDAAESALPPPAPPGAGVPEVVAVFPPSADAAPTPEPADDPARPLAEWLLIGVAALLVLEGLLYRLRLAE